MKKGFVKTLAILNSTAFASMALINHMIDASAVHKNVLRPEACLQYPWKYGRVMYSVSGSGSLPLLLIHDCVPHGCGYEWEEVSRRLENDYRIYTIDLPGCGSSDKPGITYTNYLYVQLLTGFIRDVIGEECRICAVGLSASFAVMCAFSAEDLVSDLILISPVSLGELSQVPDRSGRFLRCLLSVPVIGTSLYNIIACRSNLEYEFNEKYFYNPFHIKAKMLDAAYEGAHLGSGSGRFLIGSRRGRYLNWNLSRALMNLQQPVRILYGKKDIAGRKAAVSYKAVHQAVQIYGIPKTKLYIHLENPAAVASFLAGDLNASSEE